ncbi:hypothetical protein [Paracoccus methylarcula]|uniref:Uncharacterized protein n=1 Tax=Paracoccus methylarcula TaxID=72022 RepID=A0A3R7LP46_9RHOB|nr:hypothetical protein [Paracoccus methylarcula]RNF33981.1 hypothetical protein A7A09_013840 [Paracoccus methylarcula]
MSDHDRELDFDRRLRGLEAEIAGLHSGEITPWYGGKAYQLKLSNARLCRLVKRANEYGLWLDEEVA